MRKELLKLEDNIIKVKILGSGACFSKNRYNSSILIDDKILLDCGPSVNTNLGKMNVRTAGLEYLFISHLHGDHTFGLPVLLFDRYFFNEGIKKLHIIGYKGLQEYYVALARMAFGNDFDFDTKNPETQFVEFEENKKQFLVKDIQFMPVKLNHGQYNNYGYKIKYKDKTISYSGDTSYAEDLIDLIDESDVSIIELTFTERKTDNHLNYDGFFEAYNKCKNPGKIVFTHFQEDEILPKYKEFIYSEDFSEYEV